MYIGLGIFLLLVGLVIVFAYNGDQVIAGIDLGVIGWIAIILGALFYAVGLVLSAYAVTPGGHQLLNILIGFGVAGTGFGWATAPGTSKTFVMLADSFGLPKGVKNKTEATNWLKLLGSKAGQDAFNPLKGSIAARLDSDMSKYNVYSQSAARDWKSSRIVGSMVHGAVAPETFTSAFGALIDQFVAGKDSKAATAAAQQLADKAGIGK